ncbi:FAD-binding oxidoreductase [Streptomyces sp. 1222.5]|uniref:FAD-binding oxidoreductase n=1 Tax=Streptomyces sp. 1222.5 TaxID=1881026 RepID=UPI003EB7302D
MAWNAWGEPGQPFSLPSTVLDFLHQVLGPPDKTVKSVRESQVSLRPGDLPPWAADRLKDIVGVRHFRTDYRTRLRHTGGKSLLDLLRRCSGEVSLAPDAVVLPGDHNQVQQVLQVCGNAGVAVVPFGGGTSLVGGVEPLRGPFRAAVALDLGRLRRLVSLDATSMTVRLEAGLRTSEAETLLNARGLTLGNLPQSHAFSTIGGYTATRSSGVHGEFADMVQAMTVATPQGTLRVGRAPASAAGPDLRQLMLGSEGTLGVITEVTCRVHRLPESTHQEAWLFANWGGGLDAVRLLAQAGVRVRKLRLSDEAETFVNASIGNSGQAPAGCLAVVDYAGSAEHVALARETTQRIFGKLVGTEPVSSTVAQEWSRCYEDDPYLRDALLPAGYLAETLETAASWSDLPALYKAVGDRLRSSLARGSRPPIVLCHVSHVYATGASLCFTVVIAAENDPISQWERAKEAAGDTIAAHGGTITHHHAVGADHVPWMQQEVGEVGLEILRAAKRAVDPTGVLNPGKLIP